MEEEASLTQIDQAFNSLMASLEELDEAALTSCSTPPSRRVRRDLPPNRPASIVPRIVPQYSISAPVTPSINKLSLLRIAAFEATYPSEVLGQLNTAFTMIMESCKP